MNRFLGVVGIVLCATMARGADVDDLIKQLKDGDSGARGQAADHIEIVIVDVGLERVFAGVL